ncbi:DEAD/DEAH box helicase [Polaribacter sp. Z022]|uniref:DEAD/DEAH box helicase n=1 Tax=Polaribacter sp. Z022 TaxID=2927125 RepID=UPI002020A5B3|nr:DEAD/DEAH box helicase [Polaribacter sp. Z022]MCL7754044.1 DEAD/DEAH box helicase [Polaribacter sp. Z022]
MSKTFSDLGISKETVTRLAKLEITQPTQVQEKTIPFALFKKKDMVVLAKTGTGKTAAFGLPMLQKIDVNSATVQVLILAPTRELGRQIYENLISFASEEQQDKIVALCGGAPIKTQLESLKKQPNIVVATPGRLVDFIERKAIDIQKIQYFILDEADEMMTALKEEVATIIKEIPENRRTLLFTATMPGTIKQLVQNYMSKHIEYIETDMDTMGHKGIEHQYVVVEAIEKLNVLMHFLSTKERERGIIFCKTKAAVNKLAKNLAINKFSSGAIHGSLSQGIRDRVMGQFREGNINILVATDLAARGIDVKEVSYVVNYHLPDKYETYIHRSGRTARAGASGLSLSVIQQEEVEEIPEFEEDLGLVFTQYKKADAQSIEDNNTILWAKKIFKTKPNKNISEDVKAKVKTVFHHLTKEELIDKVLANYLAQTSQPKVITKKKK